MCNILHLPRYFFTQLVLFALMANSSMAAEATASLSGYYKNLLINSNTMAFFPPSESYLVDLNRLRLKVDGQVGEKFSFNLQYDNEAYLGSYTDTNEFGFAVKNRQPDTSIDLQDNYYDQNNVFARQRVYRAYVDVALPAVDLRIGRQRIAWGTAMMWNPMDILNPFNPIQLERLEREGIDAALLDWDYSALSRVSLVYAKKQSGDSSAVRWRSNLLGFDLSLMAGRFLENTVFGFDFAGQVGDIGVRGEMTQTDPDNERRFTHAVVGADYTFSNSLSFNLEFYFNSQGSTRSKAYQFNRLLSGDMLSLARHYMGFYSSYDVTPLLQASYFLIVNLDDNSTFFSPNLVYSVTDNIEGSAGVQTFNGDTGSEFGTFENVYFVQLQWFF